MKYVDRINWSVFIPKLLGVDRELADITQRLLLRRYKVRASS
jgi:hypothetical protein